jgi:hypothetical protein
MAQGKGRELFEEFKACIYRSEKLLQDIRAKQAEIDGPSFINVAVDWKKFIAGEKLDVLVRPARCASIWNKITPESFEQLDWSKVIIAVQIIHSGTRLHETIGILRPEEVRGLPPGAYIENYQVHRFSNRFVCIVCGKDAPFLCQRCLATPYCGDVCQKKHVQEQRHLLMCPKLSALFSKPTKEANNIS